MKKIQVVVISLVVSVSLFSFTFLTRNNFEIYKNIDIFTTLFRELNSLYVHELSSQQLIEDCINAMLASLDPYADFIPESEKEQYRTVITGEYGGIGAVVGPIHGVNTVVMPYIGFPAHKAGLLIGDKILKINQQDLDGKSNMQISEMLKGKPDTPIVLGIQRYGKADMFDVPLVRTKIIVNNVMYFGMYDHQVGVICLSNFTTNANRDVKNALDSLKRLGAKKIILDLRGNPGGLLDEAIKVTNIFVPKNQEVVSTKGKIASWNTTYKTTLPAVDAHIPLAVLISSATASAAEIVAGVVQDYDRGVLLGKQTFGKGLVQSSRPLPYNGQIKLTTAKYYIPSGRCIQSIDYSRRNTGKAVGKTPDSLKVAFKTKSGRIVYDGGGIAPDIEVEPRKFPNLLYNLASQYLIFDFVTEYAALHPSISSPRAFELSDEEYGQFVVWVQKKEVSLSLQMDKAIATLEEKAKEEQYYNGMQDAIEKLKAKVNTVKLNYLTAFEDEIRMMLEEDIVSRYYFHSGLLATTLDRDIEIQQAADLLNDTTRYYQILNQ